jgi:hypothetical protein
VKEYDMKTAHTDQYIIQLSYRQASQFLQIVLKRGTVINHTAFEVIFDLSLGGNIISKHENVSRTSFIFNTVLLLIHQIQIIFYSDVSHAAIIFCVSLNDNRRVISKEIQANKQGC